MNAQIVGCRRQVSGRKSPRSGGIVWWPAEQVLERRDVGALGVAALLRLLELLRVAEQHEAPRGLRDGQHVGERHLARPRRRRARRRRSRTPGAPTATRCRRDVGASPARARRAPRRFVGRLDAHRTDRRRRSSCRPSARSAARAPAPAPRRSAASSRLRITLWLTAVTPTFLPAATSSQIMRAPVNVLPEPGGPWIASTVSSSSRREAARGREQSSPSRRSAAPVAAQARRAAQQELARGAVAAVPQSSRARNPRRRVRSSASRLRLERRCVVREAATRVDVAVRACAS